MKKLLLWIAFAGGALAQTPVLEQNRCAIALQATSAPNRIQIDNRDKACIAWTISYSSTGLSALSIEVDGASDVNGAPGSWATFQSVTGVTLESGSNPSTTVGQESATFTGFAPWVSIYVSSITGSGSIRANLYGDRNGLGGSGGGGGGGSGCTTPCPVYGVDAIGVTPTVAPVNTGGVDSAGLVFDHQFCTLAAPIAIAAPGTGDTQILALSGTTSIRVCRISLTTSANTNIQFDYGTGTNCGTGTTHLTGVYSSVATLSEPENNAYWVLPAGKALCISQSASSTTGGTISYAQY